MVAKESGGDDDEEDEEDQETWRVLVHLPNLDSAYELVHTALSLAPRQHQRVELVLVRTLQLPETIFGSLALSQDLDTERVVRALRPVIQFVEEVEPAPSRWSCPRTRWVRRSFRWQRTAGRIWC